ncbi:MAG TPA: GNAT family protein [Bacteroidia bacterium]|nr:GNAT family protein [Bacteroidia bacterium]
MNKNILSVRELQENDIDLIIEYWLGSSPDFMKGMGVEVNKLPGKEQWRAMLEKQLNQPYHEKDSYCMIWLEENKPVGHSNVNKIKFGQEAYMHLHLWNADIRKKGMGTTLVKMTIPYFFKNIELKTLYCEPYALNPAPRKTLERVGFELIREYITTPGFICFEQPVCLWEMSYEQFKNCFKAE